MNAPIAAAALRVASDLRHLAVDNPGDQPRDVITGDAVYRLLDAPYYAWLRRRMERAKKAFDAGKLPAETWETLRERFNGINAWAIAHLGESALLAALTNLDEKSYLPPRHDHAIGLVDSWNERSAIMEHDGGLSQDAAEQSAARTVSHALTPEDVASFKALGVEVDVKSSVGNFTLVPEYTDQAGKARMEISVEDMRKISMVMHAFPGAEIVYVGPEQEPRHRSSAQHASAPKPSMPPPAPQSPQQPQPPQPPAQAPLF